MMAISSETALISKTTNALFGTSTPATAVTVKFIIEAAGNAWFLFRKRNSRRLDELYKMDRR